MHLKASFYLVIYCFLSATSSVSGQQLMFKHITEEDGLSASHVNCGLLELDLKSGIKKIYNLPKKSTILCLYAQNEENIWIGTKGQGLLLLQRSTGKWESLMDPLIAETITDLKENGPFVLAASMGDGLFNINPITKDYQQYKENEGLLNNNLNTILLMTRRDSG